MNPNYAFQIQGFDAPSFTGGNQPGYSPSNPNSSLQTAGLDDANSTQSGNTLTGYGSSLFPNSSSNDPTAMASGVPNTYGGQSDTTQGDLNADAQYNYDANQPYYSALGAYDTGNFQNTNRTQLAQYGNTIAGLQNNLGIDARALDNSEGENGTWSGTGRAQRRTDLQNKYNTAFTGAYNSAQDNLYKNRLSQAYTYGNQGVQSSDNTPISSYSTDLSGYGNNMGTSNANTGAYGTNGVYNPFASFGLGRQAYDRQAQARITAVGDYNNAVNATGLSSKYTYGNPYGYYQQIPTTTTTQ